MIDFISGKIVEKNPTNLVLQNNGIGYNLQISVNTFEHMPKVGENVKLKTYLHVREDILQLYAFAQEKERDVFLGLVSISGVGPKLAQTILSGIKVDELIHAIQRGDVQRLTTISGVGKKTAQRLVIELKEKFTQSGLLVDGQEEGFPVLILSDIEEEALLALISLGYKKAIIEKALARVRKNGSPDKVEILIKQALQNI
jgi:Holliday junction DNA helicase RuvA